MLHRERKLQKGISFFDTYIDILSFNRDKWNYIPVSTLKIIKIIGDITFHKKRIKNNKTKRAHRSRNSSIKRYRAGRMEKRIFEPSRGGIGTRLKTASTILRRTIVVAI